MLLGRLLTEGVSRPAFHFAEGAALLGRLNPEWEGAAWGDFLPPDGRYAAAAEEAWRELSADAARRREFCTPDPEWDLPVETPRKAFFLAGNYAKHVVEQGGVAAERAQTFPYVFMKPPSTTMVPHAASVRLPKSAPEGVDHEVELAVVIGRTACDVSEEEALGFVAGYTIVNDLSHRRYRPNPGRTQRERDKFFDWLHGKWFDGFCPCGPCVATPSEIPNPQQVELGLKVNGQPRQQGTTADQIFPVAAVISFISHMTTLEPGDLIATGTPHGVGAPHDRFLRAGDEVEAYIDGIGVLTTQILAPG